MPPPTDPEAAERATDAAATKLTAIGVSAGETRDADEGLGGSTVNFAHELRITRDADGTEVMITVDQAADDAPKFETAMTLPDAGDWGGTMNVRDISEEDSDDTVVEIAVVRTDIDAPTPRLFAVVYPPNANNGDDGNAQSLRIDNDNAAMVAAMMFSSGSGAGMVNFDGDDANTEDMDEAAEVMGTFDGAPGTYRCNDATGCSVTLTGGKVSAASNWIFTATMGAMVDVEDTDYLAYGFWLQRTTDKDGQDTYDEVEAFTAGNVAVTPVNDVGDVAGSATYTGNSTGVYVKNVTDNEGDIQTATSGLYSALVNLTANFGSDDVAVNKQFRIEGDVTKFVLQNGEENDWGVKLESATFPTANVFTGMTTGDSTAAKGAWNGGFYGAAPETADTEDDNARVAPPSVLGEFNANFTDGAVLGGFGANKD